MDKSGILKLLQTISVHYPTFKRNIFDEKGYVQKIVIEEWERLLGFLDYDDAIARLDAYMDSENGSRVPKPMDLRKVKSGTYTESYASRAGLQWHLEFMKWDTQKMHGRLYDQEEREYVHDPMYQEGYHYDDMGRICTITGEVIC